MRPSRSERINAVLEALAESHGQLTEAQAARLLGVGTIWFRHAFKRATGVSFRAARLHAKLDYASGLLRTTDLSIPEISARLKYADRTKFEKSFKRAYGLTPTRYRQQLFPPQDRRPFRVNRPLVRRGLTPKVSPQGQGRP